MMWLLTELATRWSELPQLPKFPLSLQFKHRFNTETEGYYESFNMNKFRHKKNNTARFLQTAKQIHNFLNLKMSQKNEWWSRADSVCALAAAREKDPFVLNKHLVQNRACFYLREWNREVFNKTQWSTTKTSDFKYFKMHIINLDDLKCFQ